MDFAETEMEVTEVYLEMGPSVVGKYKTPFGIGKYGINKPVLVRGRNGKSAMGFDGYTSYIS